MSRPLLAPGQFLTSAGARRSPPGSAATERSEGSGALSEGAADRFERSLGPVDLAPLLAVDQGARAAVDAYQSKLAQIFGDGATQDEHGSFVGADVVNGEQLPQLLDATGAFLREIPIGALSPGLRARIREHLGEAGQNVSAQETRSLSDFGAAGRDFTRSLTEGFRDERPETFYGLAVAGAAAIGYTGGSGALKALGMAPDFSTTVFDDRVTLQAKASWDPELKDPRLEGAAMGTFELGPSTRLTTGARVVFGGDAVDTLELDSASGRVLLRADDFTAEARGRFRGDRVRDLDFSVRYRAESIRLEAEAAFGEAAELDEVTLEAELRENGVELTAEVSLDPETAVDAAVAFEVSDGEVELSAAVDVEDGEVDRIDLEGRWDPKDGEVAAQLELDDSQRIESFDLDATYERDGLRVGAEVELGRDAVLESAELGVRYEEIGREIRGAVAFGSEGFEEASLEGRSRTPDADLRYGVSVDADGFDAANLELSVDRDTVDLGVELKAMDGRLRSAALSLELEEDPVELEASLRFDGDLVVKEGKVWGAYSGDVAEVGVGVRLGERAEVLGYDGTLEIADGPFTLSAEGTLAADLSLEEAAVAAEYEAETWSVTGGVSRKDDETELSLGGAFRF